MNKLLFLLSLPKTIFINFSSLPLKQAVKLPLFVDYNTCFINEGVIEISDLSNLTRFSIIFGKDGSHHIASRKSIIMVKKNAKLILGKNILLSSGINLIAEENSVIKIGNGTSFNRNCSIFSKHLVDIGCNCLFGWGVSIRDNDGHKISYPEQIVKNNNYVVVSDKCWVTAECLLMKGADIGTGSVVATRSLVNKKLSEKNSLIAGSPAKIIKYNINWEK